MSTQISKSLIALFFLGMFVTGCNTNIKQTADNDIKFDSIRVDKTYHLLDNPDNPNCNLQLSFTYPAKFSDKEILKKVQNDFVLSYFGENYENLPPEEAVAKYTEDYLNNYKELEADFKAELEKKDDLPVGAWFSYFEMSSDEIVYNQNDILSYTVSFENYTGGAHGSHAYNNHVINLKTGNAITEEDIFIENFQDSLAQILIDHIAKQNKVENPKDLENIGFFSVEEIFPNGNFLVDGDGITYTFNEYEIAAYVVRETNVFLPYAEIQYLLKKDSPIYQLGVLKSYFPTLTDTQKLQIDALFDLYSDWNSKINVISRKDIENLYLHHVLHSLGILKMLKFKEGSTVMDIGTGGGFPGIPLAILLPEVRFHLVDSIGKKIKVGQAVAEAIGLKNVTFRHCRAEEEKQLFDFVVSRAVMPLADLVKIARKNIKKEQQNALPNGLICLKGGELQHEILPFHKQAVSLNLSDHFKEEFFQTKKVVYVPL